MPRPLELDELIELVPNDPIPASAAAPVKPDLAPSALSTTPSGFTVRREDGNTILIERMTHEVGKSVVVVRIGTDDYPVSDEDIISVQEVFASAIETGGLVITPYALRITQIDLPGEVTAPSRPRIVYGSVSS